MALIKCAECGKEISSSAQACPQCGHPAAIESANHTAEVARSANKIGTWQGLALIIIIPVVGCWLIFQSESWNSPTPPRTGQSGSLTKAAWRQRFKDNRIELAAGLKQVFGEPQRSQTVGDQTFWYYQCSDGTIQVVLTAYQFMKGSAPVDHINDY